MEDAEDTFYSIKDIKQINDEEFEAVFEFDSNEGEAIGLRWPLNCDWDVW